MRHRARLGQEHRAVGHRQSCGDDVLELDQLRNFAGGRHVEYPVVMPVGDEEPIGDGLERELETARHVELRGGRMLDGPCAEVGEDREVSIW
jgi:hypothetical protein